MLDLVKTSARVVTQRSRFAPRLPAPVSWLVSALLAAFVAAGLVLASDRNPRPETLAAFDQYLEKVEESNQERLRGQAPFLWISGRPRESLEKVKKGEILTHHFNKDVDVPHGLIHNWIGVVYVPGVSGSEAVSLLRDYDRHHEIFPEAIASRTLEATSAEGPIRGYLRFENKRFVTVVLDTVHESVLRRVGDHRWFIPSRALQINEVRNAGEADEERLPLGAGRGFLWRMHAYWRIEETGDGVILESNVVTLSRSIPWIIAWFVKPIVQKFPGETMERTLEATRAALLHR